MSFLNSSTAGDGKSTILITGGGSGIGLGLAQRLLTLGHEGDIGSDASRIALFEKVVKEFPEVNVLINNAGVSNGAKYPSVKNVTAAGWESHKEVIDINLTGTIHLSILFIPHLITKKNALIANNSSILAFFPYAASYIYSATKAALHSFTISLRHQLKDTFIKVVEIAPPAVSTDMGRRLPGAIPVDLLRGESEISYEGKYIRASRDELDATFEAVNSSFPSTVKTASYKVGGSNGIPWNDFLKLDREVPGTDLEVSVPAGVYFNTCSKEVVKAVTEPALSKENYEWCQWTLSPTGGKVKAWGDEYIGKWKKNVISDVCGPKDTYTSKVHCMDSSSLARFCIFENAQFDFSKMHDVKRPERSTDSRSWDKGFLATDCDAAKYSEINFYEFYQPSVDRASARCDYVINETVLAYSHDNIHNLGHSMSDFMNVWAMLWLSGTGEYARDISFLNIDALRMGHSYKDEMNQFAKHYELQFARVLKASDFVTKGKGNVCFKRLIFQPRPVILFTWDGWWQDMKCSFVGPSSLFQRWNMQIRNNYGLLNAAAMPTNDRIQVLLIVRSISKHSSGQEGRRFTNSNEIAKALASIEGITLVVQDLAELNFEEQIKLIASSSLLIGMHGAGIASSMHMAIGTRHCCGVVEIFPDGEYKPIRGYGNMARRMGHHYERLELGASGTKSDGGEVDVTALKSLAQDLLKRMDTKPTCVLPSVISDPHFSSIPSVWGQ
eukprot:gene26796-33432_t